MAANKKDNLGNLETMETTSKRKKTIIILCFVALLVGIFIYATSSTILSVSKEKTYSQRQAPPRNDLQIIQNPEFKENWAISTENKIKNLDKKQDELAATIADNHETLVVEIKDALDTIVTKNTEDIETLTSSITAEIESIKKEAELRSQQQDNKIDQIAALVAERQTAKNTGDGSDITIGLDLFPDGTPKDNQGLTIIVPPKGEPQPIQPQINQTELNNIVPLPPLEEKKSHKRVITTVSVDTTFNKGIINAQKNINDLTAFNEDNNQKSKDTYHISTGLSKAYMITGAYAPAFQEAQSDPLPVLFEAEGTIIQPNDNLGNADKCFLLGSAKGNMNTQSANIKLITISCLIDDGRYRIEAPISGWVIGENGIPGVQGELLHKNGAWLARTFISGFLETFSKALAGSNSVQINLGGSVGDVSDGIRQNTGSAAAEGFSTVFGKLGEYYLKMAEQIFPVIEVRGGRTVDLLLMGGEDFTLVENNKFDLSIMNTYIQEMEKNKLIQNEQATEVNAFTRSIINENSNLTDTMQFNTSPSRSKTDDDDVFLIDATTGKNIVPDPIIIN